ncbi:hypothetical protein AAK967_05375 [Atopobiaceae bacterium 24-176]
MSQSDDKTIAFRPRRGDSPEPPDEPVYEVDDVAVGPDGSVSPRPAADGELAAPSERARARRRTRPSSDAGEPTPLRQHPSRRPSSAAATGDLRRARDAARSQAAGRSARSASASRERRLGAAGSGASEQGRGRPEDAAPKGRRRPKDKERGRRGKAKKGTPFAGVGAAVATAGGAVASAARSVAQRLSSAVTSAGGAKNAPSSKRVSRDKRGASGDNEQAEAKRRLPRPSRRVAIVLAVVALAAVSLYGPARDLYMARRNNQILRDVLTEISTENSALGQRARELLTDQGIEDEARLHGYVKQGEEAATVTGLPGEQEGQAIPIPDNVRAEVLAREDPWYVQALDRLFFYQKGDQNHE